MLEEDRSLLEATACVLCVVDKQRWYFDKNVSPFAREQDELAHKVSTIDRLIETARSVGVPVIWTVNSEGAEYSPENSVRRWRIFAGEPTLSRGDEGFEFFGEKPKQSEQVFEKVYPDAFSSKEFSERVGSLDRKTLILVGGYAGRCILATAFSAQTRGYMPFLVKGLAVPHPWFPNESEGAEHIVDTLVGGVVEVAELEELWIRNSL